MRICHGGHEPAYHSLEFNIGSPFGRAVFSCNETNLLNFAELVIFVSKSREKVKTNQCLPAKRVKTNCSDRMLAQDWKQKAFSDLFHS